MDEMNYLHESLLAQLKDTATSTYNEFYRAFNMLNDNKSEAELIFLKIVKNTDYLLSSMEFYNDKFIGLDRSEDYLYLSQLVSLQAKACHDLAVIFISDKNEVEMNRYASKKESYRKILYSYYLLTKENPKVNKIIEVFLRELDILNSKAVK